MYYLQYFAQVPIFFPRTAVQGQCFLSAPPISSHPLAGLGEKLSGPDPPFLSGMEPRVPLRDDPQPLL